MVDIHHIKADKRGGGMPYNRKMTISFENELGKVNEQDVLLLDDGYSSLDENDCETWVDGESIKLDRNEAFLRQIATRKCEYCMDFFNCMSLVIAFLLYVILQVYYIVKDINNTTAVTSY